MSKLYAIAIPLAIFLFLSVSAWSQNQKFWTLQNSSALSPIFLEQIPSDQFQLLSWQADEIKNFLKNTPNEFSLESQRMFKRLNIPDLEGNENWYRVLQTDLLSPETAEAFPFIQAYILISEENPAHKGRLLVSHLGVHLSMLNDGFTTYIQPFREGSGLHFIYRTDDIIEPMDFQCLTEHGGGNDEEHQHGGSRYGDCQLRTYRFAVAATGEYTTWAGSQANALASIAATVNNMNVVFERDVEVRLTLVSDNSVIFTDAGTDPYNTSILNTTLLNNNTSTLNSNIGISNYDIGHVFHAGWNGGLAYRPAACDSNKGGGASGMNNPTGYVFETIANHEVGHMLNARHSYSANNGGCGGGNLDLMGAVEPGGGSTLMSYNGVCSPNSYQNNADNYFHTASMAAMSAYTTMGTGSSCGTVSGGNTAPTVTVSLSTYTIPNGTPFVLTAMGVDPNGNPITYTWEQIDLAPAGISTPPLPTATSGPNFRSRPPSTNPARYFPPLDNVVSGTDNDYEVLPTVARTMNFRVTARDNAAIYGCTDEADVAIITTGSGPFQVTAPAGPVSFTANGANTFEVTWDVAGSTAAPVSCANVDILFSSDGGSTFSTILLSATPNDGSQTILVPNIETSSGRIMVRCSNGIFYNVNEGFITISSGCLAVGGSISPSADLVAEEGSAELVNMGMSAEFGVVITPISGSVVGTDISSTLVIYNSGTMSCINFNGNDVNLDTIPFYVSVTGTYTLERASPFGLVSNIYQSSFNLGTLCENFLASSYSTGSGSSINVTANLTAGVKYILVISSFDVGTPSLPAAYTVTVNSAPPGGALISGPLNPGAGFSYTFIVRDAPLGNIIQISDNPDLTTLSAGTYVITGLSYSNTSILPSLPILYSSFINQYVVNGLGGFCGQISANERIVIIQGPLSVNFVNFEAVKVQRHSKLSWTTQDEIYLAHYVIERSRDAVDFEFFARVELGSGYKNEVNQYHLIDEDPLTGKNYYRLSAVDIDGTITYAGIVQLTFESGKNLKIFPNPINGDILRFELFSNSISPLYISVYNMQGILLSQSKLENTGQLTNQQLNVAGIPAGVFIVEINDGLEKIRQKFVKSR